MGNFNYPDNELEVSGCRTSSHGWGPSLPYKAVSSMMRVGDVSCARLSINSHIALARNIRDSHRSVHVEKCALPVRMRLFALLKTRNTPFPPGFVTELTTMTLQWHLCIGLWKKWVDLDVFVSGWKSIELFILLWIKVITEWWYIPWHIKIKIVKAKRSSFF